MSIRSETFDIAAGPSGPAAGPIGTAGSGGAVLLEVVPVPGQGDEVRLKKMPTRPTDANDASLREAMARHLGDFRRAVEGFLGGVGSPGSPRELQRRFGVSYILCWQIFQLAEGLGGLGDAKHAPTPTRLKGLLAKAVEEGLDAGVAERLLAVSDEFHQFAKRHAHDRAGFESLLSGLSGPVDEAAAKIHVKQRRELFRSLSSIWGKQVDFAYQAWMMAHEGPGTRRVCTLAARLGMRRLKPDAELMLFGGRGRPDEWKPLDPVSFEKWGMPVLERFSPDRVPPVRVERNPDGWCSYFLDSKSFGLTGSTSVVSGQWCEGLQVRGTDQTSIYVGQPMGQVVLDWIVERGSFGDLSGGRLRLSNVEAPRAGITPEAMPGLQRFPVEEKVSALGRADLAAGVPEVPDWRGLVSYAAAEMRWDLAGFDVYRVRIPFPIWGTTIRLAVAEPG